MRLILIEDKIELCNTLKKLFILDFKKILYLCNDDIEL